MSNGKFLRAGGAIATSYRQPSLNSAAFIRLPVSILLVSLLIGLFSLPSFAKGIQGLPDFTPLVKANRAAVVNIGTTSKREMPEMEGPRGGPMPGVPDDNALQDFFRKFFGDEGRGGGQPSPETLSSLGSGFIISEDGYVISNYHVVREADEVIVRMSDRKEYVAEIIGTDPRSDIAVLKIEADKPLPALKLGKSANLEVGEWVLAIGSPFGFDHSVTAGIVSAKGRSLPNENYVPFIQTDVAINPGNSGGPLVNMAGEVIGVNTRGGEGNGFATPTSIARGVAEELREHGEVARSWIGVGFKHLERTGYDQGVFVDWVDTDGPAAAAGMQAGDLVTAVNGQSLTIKFPEQIPPLLRTIASQPVGTLVNFAVRRGDASITIEVTTDQLQLDESDPVSLRQWGLTVSDITPYAARMYQLDSSDGVRIDSTRSGMPAELADPALQGGDIIHSVHGTAVTTVRELVEIYTAISSDDDAPEYIVVEFDRWGDAMVTAVDTTPPESATPPRDLPKAWLGVETQPIIPELAKHLGTPTGFRVTRIYPQTMAAMSDLRVGDIITAVGDIETKPNAIEQAGAFERAVKLQTIGETVALAAHRDGAAIDLPVTFERSPLSPEQARRVRNRDFGLVVRSLTFIDRVNMKLDDDFKGAYVESVEEGGWASVGGISYGDIILAIDEHEVKGTKSYTEAMEAVTEAASERVVFKVRRRNRVSYKFVEPEWSPQIDTDDPSP